MTRSEKIRTVRKYRELLAVAYKRLDGYEADGPERQGLEGWILEIEHQLLLLGDDF